MKQIPKKLLIKILLPLIVLASAIVLFFYLNPQEIASGETIAMSAENPNDTFSVSLSLKRVNFLFKPTKIQGEIVFDGVEYVNMSSFGKGYDIYESKGFFENLKLKSEGFTYDLFVRADTKEKPMKIYNDTILLGEVTSDTIMIYKFNNKDGITIYNILLDE